MQKRIVFKRYLSFLLSFTLISNATAWADFKSQEKKIPLRNYPSAEAVTVNIVNGEYILHSPFANGTSRMSVSKVVELLNASVQIPTYSMANSVNAN
ncbi:MAG: hypothetical protein KDD40_02335, partial [Bdellovibrionales bacterium]|nr:hypothetical protein [Bdellovibrionales bacterium]